LVYIDNLISDILNESNKTYPNKKPFVRVKIWYSGGIDFVNVKKIESKYQSMVANMEKIIVFMKKKEIKPAKITDDELFNIIKNKEMLVRNSTATEDIEQVIRNLMELEILNFYGKEESLEQLSQMLQADLSEKGEILNKGLDAIQKLKVRQIEDQVIKLTAKRDAEWKKAMRYHKDKMDHILFDKPIPPFYGVKDIYELISIEKNFMDDVQYNEYTKKIERIAACKEVEEQP
jgi:hypothetical protein